MTTDDEVLLSRYTVMHLPGYYFFEGSSIGHLPGPALDIIKACLMLDVPVTDRLMAEAWIKVVMKLADLEMRLSMLEVSIGGGNGESC